MSNDPVTRGPFPAADAAAPRRPRPWVLAVGPVLALVAGGGVGTLVGSVIAVVWSEVRSTNQWDRLGIYFFSTLIGLLVAVVAYIVALTVVAWRLFPPGRRAVPVLLTLLAHVIVLGVTAVLMATLQPAEDAYAAASMLLTLAGLACGPAVFPACGTTGRLRFAAVATVAAIILTAGVVTVVSHVFARETAYVNGHAGS